MTTNITMRRVRVGTTRANPAQTAVARALPHVDKAAGEDHRRRPAKSGTRTEKKEPNITAIVGRDGKKTYRVQIRRRIDGADHSMCHTFSSMKVAKTWRDKKLAESALFGFPVKIRATGTVADVIDRRLEKQQSLGRSTRATLRGIKKHSFGETPLTAKALYDFADQLLDEERGPATVAQYMTHLSRTLKWAADREYPVERGAVMKAMALLWDDEILARSESRDRRPTLEELDKILSAATSNVRQKIPLVPIVAFAIFSTRRLGEICRLRWEDLDEDEATVLVRDMKHPRKKKGNDVTVHLSPEALAIIQAMPRVDARIFPYNERSVGAAWRRHRERVRVTGLRFHDLRHEGISRLFEMGMTAPFVKLHSGHMKNDMLDPYTHVKKADDRFAGWVWLERAKAKAQALTAA